MDYYYTTIGLLSSDMRHPHPVYLFTTVSKLQSTLLVVVLQTKSDSSENRKDPDILDFKDANFLMKNFAW